MPTTDFVSGVTLSDAAWADDVDIVTYAYLTSPAGTNTITATGPATFTYAAGRLVRFLPAATNTGATTINITPSGGTALGARNIFFNGAACIGGELRINVPVELMDDGTRFHIVANGSGRGWNLLAVSTAAASATMQFTSTQITSTYDQYRLLVSNLTPATDNSDLHLEVSVDNGSTWIAGTSSYRHTRFVQTNISSVVSNGAANASSIVMSLGLGNAIGENFNADIGFSIPAGTTVYKNFRWNADYVSAATDVAIVHGAGAYLSTAAINAVRVRMSAGNISTANLALYGIRT